MNMCRFEGSWSAASDRDTQECKDPFPFDAGMFDAHCHPTDTMASIARIQDMRAQILTVMSTRSQDQQLVSSVASDLAINSEATLFDPSEPKKDRKIVPAFGWHPCGSVW